MSSWEAVGVLVGALIVSVGIGCIVAVGGIAVSVGVRVAGGGDYGGAVIVNISSASCGVHAVIKTTKSIPTQN